MCSGGGKHNTVGVVWCVGFFFLTKLKAALVKWQFIVNS